MHPRPGIIPDIVRPLLADPDARAIPAAEVLASLLDLRGSVELSEILEARPTSWAPEPPSLRPFLDLRARLGEIEAAIQRRLAAPFAFRGRILDAEAMHEALAEAGARDEQRPLVRSLSASLRDRLVSMVDLAQGEIASLREEISSDLRAAGPEAARLEALDRGLRDATERGLARLVERLAGAIERAVLRDFTRALKKLPEAATPNWSAFRRSWI